MHELAGNWAGLWQHMETEIFGTSQSASSSGAVDPASQSSEHLDAEVMREMVELADSGCRVYWPPELSLAQARQRLAEPKPPQQAEPVAVPASEADFVFSSQELEAELDAQLELEGWL